ncbi:LptF/LptG family permease [Dysgonomonas sp. GY75]|uniref:LptF/LptG family permease n=1 Tax=Dysgonomonas sp. GY75 TaxID=2780419 RepID=UPI0018839DA4|nr:LptF/LptG family permease [Dysgonomonas sp. GY75]MBF0650149.1 LptF/LptG family permease [Dysgonomonas sp. GY75]
MLKIKRLYTFVIQTFLPVFAMTFVICLFIVLMQFLWRYVEDLVGKGLDISVLAELFLYAAFQLIPMALPLSLLLASLMAFGNLGERLELLSIKASGVSLLKAMKPLIILVAFISIGAFFFQNEAMPRIQVKLRALLWSIKQKSPELDIPEGSFYSDIPNYNLYVKKKNRETKMLHEVMIYDTSKGFDNMAVIVCDSALMRGSEDKTFLLLNLYHGQQFANFRQADVNSTSSRNNNQFAPYSRENFKEKEVIIPFNTGFDRMDESNLEGTQISKNIVQLSHSIDSMSARLDSVNIRDRKIIGQHTYFSYRNTEAYQNRLKEADSLKVEKPKALQKKEQPAKIDFDSLLNSYSRDEMAQHLMSAASEAENSRYNMLESTQKAGLQKNIRFHEVERHRKFTLSFACLIFFFIGAPLGAIIRKGGLGMPVVVSVALFIVYYIIDNIGYKMARDGVWEAWQGMWLSSFALFPLGVFLTYKAMNDSALFNPEAYGKFIRKIFFIKTPPKISDERRNIIVKKIPDVSELDLQPEILNGLRAMDTDKLRDLIQNYKKYNYEKDMQLAALSILKERGAEIGGIIDKQDAQYMDNAEFLYDYSSKWTMAGYILCIFLLITNLTGFSWIIDVSYLFLFIRSMFYYFAFYTNIKKRSKLYHFFIVIFSFMFYPLVYFYVTRQIGKDKKEVEIISYS